MLGAGGCFGNWTAKYLSADYDVIGSGRSNRKGPAFTVGAGFPYRAYIIGTDNEFLVDWLDAKKPDVIVNFAAQGEGAASFDLKNQKYFYQTNAVALVDLVSQLSTRKYLKRFIQIGTSEVYGSTDVPSKESDQLNPSSPYAVSKMAFDAHLSAVWNVQGFPMNIIRPSNCYVPGQQLHRVIPKALIHGLRKQKLPLHGGGVAEKSYLHGTDLAKAIQFVIEKAPFGDIYNCGPVLPTKIKKVVEMCAKTLGMKLEDLCEVAPDREGQDSRYWLDSSKLCSLGWSPKVTWEEGLDEMAHWIRAYPELLNMPTDFVMRA